MRNQLHTTQPKRQAEDGSASAEMQRCIAVARLRTVAAVPRQQRVFCRIEGLARRAAR